MAQHGITDTIGFLQHARGFDRDGNEYLNLAELGQAAASFVAAGSLVEAQVGQTQTFDTSTMTPEQLAWYEQAKQLRMATTMRPEIGFHCSSITFKTRVAILSDWD